MCVRKGAWHEPRSNWRVVKIEGPLRTAVHEAIPCPQHPGMGDTPQGELYSEPL